MRIGTVLFASSIALSGCASLQKQVFDQIHEGDSKSRVVEVLGQPDSFGPSARIPGATAWYYVRRSEMCGFTIGNDKVKAIGCWANPNYVNPAAAMLKGMGDSITSGAKDSPESARSTPKSCITNLTGGTAYTTCN